MSFVDIVAATSGVIGVITGISAFVEFMSKNYKNNSAMAKVFIKALMTIALIFLVLCASLLISRPQIAVNRYTGVPLPGQTAPILGNSNTVVVVTQPPTPPASTKTYDENRTLTCISSCYSGLTVKLNTVVINASRQNMTWNFTVTNNGTSACSLSSVAIYLEDPAGTQIDGSAPGTLTESTPLNSSQTLQEYTTIALVPQSNVVYTLHATPDCNRYDDTDQVETFQFN